MLGGLSRSLFASLAAFMIGCPAPDPKAGLSTMQQPDHFLDYNEFVCNVEPVLVRRCSYLGCHGRPDHALRIYSAGKLRLGDVATRSDLDSALSADEVERNFESASGIVYSASAADRQAPNIQNVLLLAKPLAARFGGSEHHGLGIFPASPAKTPSDDPEWTALVAWVGGKKQPNPVTPECAKFFMAMGLSPRSP